ncbi:Chloroperoxidase [Cyathus striatus]|nr:Chloroperoxidase [Cyathus striatus]
MYRNLLFFLSVAGHILRSLCFPAYAPLHGLSDDQLNDILTTLHARAIESPPGPINDTSPKLVNDKDHPWKAPKAGDIRGPCPGLNTLASHGYIPRNGIATPAQLVAGVQEGFNMGYDLALFVTYAGMLVDGNLVTNLLSIGHKTPLTGQDPPKPATAGGLNTHAVLEGDVSMTRGDAFFGDNHNFNETLFQELSIFADRYGGGFYNFTSIAEFRWHRIQESLAANPEFTFTTPRYYTAYADCMFPLLFFVDGRVGNEQLSLEHTRGFFQDGRMPDGFHRSNGSKGIDVIGDGITRLMAAHPIKPGRNQGTGNYVLDTTNDGLTPFCSLYTRFVNETVRSLYPNPTGVLLDSLNANLDFFFEPFKGLNCTQIFPYGK